jgi:trimethylamine:corrinoid methyltransferase-like protein
MNRAPFQAWVDRGSHDLAATAAARVDELLAAYAPPDDLDATTRRQLDAYCLG